MLRRKWCIDVMSDLSQNSEQMIDILKFPLLIIYNFVGTEFQ